MSKIYANPFNWGEPVKGNHYVQRSEEQTFILSRLENQTHLVLTGRRGTGKTSLLNFILDKGATPFIYLDLRFIVDRQGLFDLLLQGMKTSFPQAKLNENPEHISLAKIFNLWYDQVKGSNKKFILVWDEFQYLVKFKEDIVEELRLSLNGKRGITHLFVSYRDDIMHECFANTQKPFFSTLEFYELENLEQKSCTRYLSTQFRRLGLSDFDLPQAVYNMTGGQPLFTQRLAYTVAQIWLEGTTTRLLPRALSKLLKERNIFFTTMWDQFGLNEKRLFKGLASGYSRPTELGFIAKFGLSATSTAHNTVLKLVREGWVVNRDEGYHIYDPLFLSWLQNSERSI